MYKKFFMTNAEKQAMKDGYIYIHDRSTGLHTFNCCLAKVSECMKDGFEMGNVWYGKVSSLRWLLMLWEILFLALQLSHYGGFIRSRQESCFLCKEEL